MNLTKETFKQPQTWAVLIPALLCLWALSSLAAMNSAGSSADKQIEQSQKAQADARQIRAIMKETGAVNLPGATSREFDTFTSVRACAKAAFIPETKLPKGESHASTRQADGSYLTRESYSINTVSLLQLARFIDHAENDYVSVTCTNLTLNHARSKLKDAWDATLDIQYITR